MRNRKRSVWASLIICFLFVGVLTVALFLMPWAVKWWFGVYRGWSGEVLRGIFRAFMWCFYPCAAFAYVALYSLIRLLLNIKGKEVFVAQNVTYLRRVSWCCFAVSAITLVGSVQYFPFLVVAVAAAFVGLMLRVVKNVMQNAVEIQNENELTI